MDWRKLRNGWDGVMGGTEIWECVELVDGGNGGMGGILGLGETDGLCVQNEIGGLRELVDWLELINFWIGWTGWNWWIGWNGVEGVEIWQNGGEGVDSVDCVVV